MSKSGKSSSAVSEYWRSIIATLNTGGILAEYQCQSQEIRLQHLQYLLYPFRQQITLIHVLFCSCQMSVAL